MFRSFLLFLFFITLFRLHILQKKKYYKNVIIYLHLKILKCQSIWPIVICYCQIRCVFFLLEKEMTNWYFIRFILGIYLLYKKYVELYIYYILDLCLIYIYLCYRAFDSIDILYFEDSNRNQLQAGQNDDVMLRFYDLSIILTCVNWSNIMGFIICL